MLRLTPCSCGGQYLVRLNRTAWMRLVPTRRHYFCAKCKCTQFLPRRDFVSWWLPSVPAQPAAAPRPPVRAPSR